MKVPISWLKEFVEFDLPLQELARRLTLAGLEVEEILYYGLPKPDGHNSHGKGSASVTAISGMEWDPETIVVGEIREVMPHPNADRLVLCRLFDGGAERQVLTGAANLFEFKGKGELERPLKVAYARRGARLIDGNKPGRQLMTLEPVTIRGVESDSMACSEKELGISDEHEGIILLDDEATAGTPLVEYMGDAVFDIAITPNIARDASILGVAREVAAVLDVPLRPPDLEVNWTGPTIEGKVALEIEEPELNPRFVLGLVERIRIEPSPYWIQYRLRLAGVRPISNIVDATNYAMLEIGEPLHAFDYDILVERAGGEPPRIITRTAEDGEWLATLDGVERQLQDYMVLVTDQAGPLSIAGVMGGLESEVHEGTVNVLLEGASWEYINIRRTTAALRLASEASYRFSRGVHPALAEPGVRRGLQLMQRLTGGVVAEGLVDVYPQPPQAPTVEFSLAEIERWLGLTLSGAEVMDILGRLGFETEVDGQTVRTVPPPHRLDIGEGLVGMADVMEEIARIYGYDRIPTRIFAEEIPSQPVDKALEHEELIRDVLVDLGLQEIVTYRLTTSAREARALPPGAHGAEATYVRLDNPSSSEREVMRRSLLSSVLEIVEANAGLRRGLALFEIAPIYLPVPGEPLPLEQMRLVMTLYGPTRIETWADGEPGDYDYFDMKGVIEQLVAALRLQEVSFQVAEHPSFHPGKTAGLEVNGTEVGVFGELHPLVAEQYDLAGHPVIAATFNLANIVKHIPGRFELDSVPAYPPVFEDIAVVVEDQVSAAALEQVIREAGGELLAGIRLFDLYRGDQIGTGRKSLAYSLVYQAADRTLTDEEVAEVRSRIVAALKKKAGGELRS